MREVKVLALICLVHQCLSAITEDPRAKEEAYQKQLREYRQLRQQRYSQSPQDYRYYHQQAPQYTHHTARHHHRHPNQPQHSTNEQRLEQLRRERQNRVHAEQRRRSVEFPKAVSGSLRAHVENDYLATNRIQPEQKWDARPNSIDNEILNTEKQRSDHYRKERERLESERIAKDKADKDRELEAKRQEKYRHEYEKELYAKEHESKRKEKLRLERERQERERLDEERRQEELRKADEERKREDETRRAVEMRRLEEERKKDEERREQERLREEEMRREHERRKERKREEERREQERRREEASRRALEEKMRKENELREIEIRKQEDHRKERERQEREWRARQTTRAPVKPYGDNHDSYQAQLAAYQKRQEQEMLKKIRPTHKPHHHHHHHQNQHHNHLATNRIENNAIQEAPQTFHFIESVDEVQRAVERGETWMVLIYAPWCGHSRKAIREYPHIAADMYKVTGRKITVAAFNVKTFEHAPVPHSLFTRYIPTIRLFGPGIQNYIEYDGFISAEWVVPWLNEEVSRLNSKRRS